MFFKCSDHKEAGKQDQGRRVENVQIHRNDQGEDEGACGGNLIHQFHTPVKGPWTKGEKKKPLTC